VAVELFHVSEESGIQRFVPRVAAGAGESCVWAIDAARLRNYLVPRECPRVTFYAGISTTVADAQRFLGERTAVVAIERGWLERVRSCRLYCYAVPTETFLCMDDCAGYFVSQVAVVPTSVNIIVDAAAELERLGVELRIVPTLWPLRDAVVASSLQFSIIRMRNARPRETPEPALIRRPGPDYPFF
jgi:hypothetical protein